MTELFSPADNGDLTDILCYEHIAHMINTVLVIDLYHKSCNSHDLLLPLCSGIPLESLGIWRPYGIVSTNPRLAMALSFFPIFIPILHIC